MILVLCKEYFFNVYLCGSKDVFFISISRFFSHDDLVRFVGVVSTSLDKSYIVVDKNLVESFVSLNDIKLIKEEIVLYEKACRLLIVIYRYWKFFI